MLGVRYNLYLSGAVRSVTSYGHETIWDGQIQTAKCNKTFAYPHGDASPEENCLCGFYAFRQINQMDGLVERLAHDGVVLIVEAFGKTILHERGFRTQYIRPLATVWPIQLAELEERFSEAPGGLRRAFYTHSRYIIPSIGNVLHVSRLLKIPIVTELTAQEMLG